MSLGPTHFAGAAQQKYVSYTVNIILLRVCFCTAAESKHGITAFWEHFCSFWDHKRVLDSGAAIRAGHIRRRVGFCSSDQVARRYARNQPRVAASSKERGSVLSCCLQSLRRCLMCQLASTCCRTSFFFRTLRNSHNYQVALLRCGNSGRG